MGLVAPWHVGSSRSRARTRVPCIDRQILNHCTTREVFPLSCLDFFFFFNFYWGVVDLQCCVGFRCTAKWICYTYTYIHFFYILFPYTALIFNFKVFSKTLTSLDSTIGYLSRVLNSFYPAASLRFFVTVFDKMFQPCACSSESPVTAEILNIQCRAGESVLRTVFQVVLIPG